VEFFPDILSSLKPSSSEDIFHFRDQKKSSGVKSGEQVNKVGGWSPRRISKEALHSHGSNEFIP
jgi:hypothetical protein